MSKDFGVTHVGDEQTSSFFLQLFLPFLYAAVTLLLNTIRTFVLRESFDPTDKAWRCFRQFIVLTITTYHTLCMRCFSVFKCTTFPDGKSYMGALPQVCVRACIVSLASRNQQEVARSCSVSAGRVLDGRAHSDGGRLVPLHPGRFGWDPVLYILGAPDAHQGRDAPFPGSCADVGLPAFLVSCPPSFFPCSSGVSDASCFIFVGFDRYEADWKYWEIAMLLRR